MIYAVLFVLLTLMVIVHLVGWIAVDRRCRGKVHPCLMWLWLAVIIVLSALAGRLFALANMAG